MIPALPLAPSKNGHIGWPPAFLESLVKLNAMPAFCPQRPASRAARGGDIEAGPTPDDGRPRDDPDRGPRHHPPPPRRRPHRTAHRRRPYPAVSRPPLAHGRCGADRWRASLHARRGVIGAPRCVPVGCTPGVYAVWARRAPVTAGARPQGCAHSQPAHLCRAGRAGRPGADDPRKRARPRQLPLPRAHSRPGRGDVCSRRLARVAPVSRQANGG
jgi:hypothetical protein